MPTVTVKGYDANNNYLGVLDSQDFAQPPPGVAGQAKALDGVVYRYNGPWWENGAPTGGYTSPSTVTKDFLFVWYPRASGDTDSFWTQWSDVNAGIGTADGSKCYIGTFNENTKEFTVSSQYSPHRSPQYTQEICGAVCFPYGLPPVASLRGIEPLVEWTETYVYTTTYQKFTDVEVVYTGENIADFVLNVSQNVYYDYQQDPDAGAYSNLINNVNIGIRMHVDGAPGVLPRGQNIPVSLTGSLYDLDSSGTLSFLYAVPKDGNFDIVCSGVETGPASQTVGASRWVQPPAEKYSDAYEILLDAQGNPYELDSTSDPLPAGAPEGSSIQQIYIGTGTNALTGEATFLGADGYADLDPPLYDLNYKYIVRYPINASLPQTALDDIFDV